MQQYSNWQGPHRIPARLWYPQVLGEKLRINSMQVLKVRLLYSVAYITDSIIDHDTLANGYDCRHLSNELELWSEADVLEFAIHLVFCTHITPEHFANVSQHTSLYPKLRTKFRPHRGLKWATKAEWTTGAFIHLRSQSAHEAWMAKVAVHASTAVFTASTHPGGPLSDVLWLSLELWLWLIDHHYCLLLLWLIVSLRRIIIPLHFA